MDMGLNLNQNQFDSSSELKLVYSDYKKVLAGYTDAELKEIMPAMIYEAYKKINNTNALTTAASVGGFGIIAVIAGGRTNATAGAIAGIIGMAIGYFVSKPIAKAVTSKGMGYDKVASWVQINLTRIK
ncbi:MAG: hypothetical protein KKD48_01980 [Nanoarchaeota archaeon]|nr:hypothetical protein [Nanoarchaeota archaeon]